MKSLIVFLLGSAAGITAYKIYKGEQKFADISTPSGPITVPDFIKEAVERERIELTNQFEAACKRYDQAAEMAAREIDAWRQKYNDLKEADRKERSDFNPLTCDPIPGDFNGPHGPLPGKSV